MSNCTEVAQATLPERDRTVWCHDQEKPIASIPFEDWTLEEFQWGGLMVAHKPCGAFITDGMVDRSLQVCSRCGVPVNEKTNEFFTNIKRLRRL